MMSLIRASSVCPVLGEAERYQESVVEVFRAVMAIFREVFDFGKPGKLERRHKKTAGLVSFGGS